VIGNLAGDIAARSDGSDDVTFSSQLRKGDKDGGAADRQVVGEPATGGQLGAGRKHAGKNDVADPAVDLLVQRLDPGGIEGEAKLRNPDGSRPRA
jgi:hypothetical protein